MHEVEFESTNSKRYDLKSYAFLWAYYLELLNVALSKLKKLTTSLLVL